MQKIVSKYALAAHLAVMAVAPLFLLPFFGTSTTATVLLWLSAFGFIWLLMEPSRRRGEMLHNARERVSRAVLRDPLFWFSLVLVGYACIRAINNGIGLSYDAELMVWSVRAPLLEFFPGCVDGAGYFPLVSVVALAIVFQATRHALGRMARSAFLLVGSVLSGVTAIILSFAASYRAPVILEMMACPTTVDSYFGTVFGIQLLAGLVALFNCVENRWMRAEPLAALGLIGNAIGLIMFSPLVTIAAFLGAFLILVVVSFVTCRRRIEGTGSLRCALTVLMTLGAPVLFALASDSMPAMVAKVADARILHFLQDDFSSVRTALSAIALKTWKMNPWIGTGLGTFPLDIRFAATAADWSVISPIQQTALNGWWQLLAERGVIGTLMIAVALGMLLWTYFARLVYSFRNVSFSPEHVLGILVLIVLAALALVDCSFLRPEVLLLAGACVSLSGGALPERTVVDEEEKGG